MRTLLSAISSAEDGIPTSPFLVLTNPSCIDPPLASQGSSQLMNTVKLIEAAYSREFLSTAVSSIASRAFETPTHPISRRALISAKTCPLRPSVSAPIQYAAVEAFSNDYSRYIDETRNILSCVGNYVYNNLKSNKYSPKINLILQSSLQPVIY